MKQFKRIFSILLAAIVIFSLAVTVIADESDEPKALNEPVVFEEPEAFEEPVALNEPNWNFPAGFNPWVNEDPGLGPLPIELVRPNMDWGRRAVSMDSRTPTNTGSWDVVPYPFWDNEGKGDVLRINYVHTGAGTFGGISLRASISPATTIPANATLHFDMYYPVSNEGKLMRWRIGYTATGTVSADTGPYVRGLNFGSMLNPPWTDFFEGELWLKESFSMAAPTGGSNAAWFGLELHGETSRPAETAKVIVDNIRFTVPDSATPALPMVNNPMTAAQSPPLKDRYNAENGTFMVGAIGVGTPSGTRARHYQIFVDGNNLKAEGTHPRGPLWLTNINGNRMSGGSWATNQNPVAAGTGEYSFPTASYQQIRDASPQGHYKSHAHVLAWYNQAPTWMRQMIPATLPAGFEGDVNFYGLGNGVPNTLHRVTPEMASRVQYNHTMYVMRHFLTTDTKYGSSAARGIIPFNSWDVINEEVHESRHRQLIPQDPDNWRTSLKHTNWLVAMSDDAIGGDLKDHYLYKLFKYAHIAAPNAAMAEAFKANYDDLPDYMKMDGHAINGSIDMYVLEEPPILVYNDYDMGVRSKARTTYNMVRDLNLAWLDDPLYDGRPLIESVGLQGHDTLGPDLASNNQYAMALFASLCREGLLVNICFSEFDIKLPASTPGGGALAPAALNVMQSQALGYQYALMYRLFEKYADFVGHIISWGVQGSGWQNSYVLFDGQGRAMSSFYAAYYPNRFMEGHPHLESFFAGQYAAVQDDYKVYLGDGLGYFSVGPQCDICGDYGCDFEHVQCEICGQYDIDECFTDAYFLRHHTADVLINGFSTDQLVLSANNRATLTLVIGGREFVLAVNVNNRNVSGSIELPDGSGTLVFDIKGNGSNVKEFTIIPN